MKWPPRRLAVFRDTDPQRPGETPAQRRLIRVMTRRGGKGFRILRSAEAPLKKEHRRRDG